MATNVLMDMNGLNALNFFTSGWFKTVAKKYLSI
jgi:hypothetical protein